MNITLQPHVRNALKQIIKASKDAIDKKDYESIYKVEQELYMGQFTPDLTMFLLSLNINPLEYMHYIPKKYAYNLPLTEVNIPNHIKEIGESAFEGTHIENIVIPESVTVIQDNAFMDCDNLQAVAFNSNSFKFEKFGEHIFEGCYNLSHIYFKDQLLMNDFNSWHTYTRLGIPYHTIITHL